MGCEFFTLTNVIFTLTWHLLNFYTFALVFTLTNAMITQAKKCVRSFLHNNPPRKSNLFHAMNRRQKDPHLSLSTKISFYICVHKVFQNSIKTKVFGDNQQWIMLALWSEIKFLCVLIHASEVEIYSIQTEYITRSSSINLYYYISAYFSFELKLKSNPVGRRIFFLLKTINWTTLILFIDLQSLNMRFKKKSAYLVPECK